MRSGFLVLALAVSAVACGDPLTAYEGIYEISGWSENPDSCASDGDSILDQQSNTALLVREQEFFGVEFVSAVPCQDVADCEQRAADEDTIDLSGFTFDEGDDDSGWTGSSYILYDDGAGGDCSGEVRQATMTSPSNDVLRIATEFKDVTGIGHDADGFCDGDEAKEVAADQACDRLEVIEATFVSDL